MWGRFRANGQVGEGRAQVLAVEKWLKGVKMAGALLSPPGFFGGCGGTFGGVWGGLPQYAKRFSEAFQVGKTEATAQQGSRNRQGRARGRARRMVSGMRGFGLGCYLPPRPFLFGGWSQPPPRTGFLRDLPTFTSHGPGGRSGLGPRLRGGLPFTLDPIGAYPLAAGTTNFTTTVTLGKSGVTGARGTR